MLVDLLSFSGGLSAALATGLIFGGVPGVPFLAGGALLFVASQRWTISSRR